MRRHMAATGLVTAALVLAGCLPLEEVSQLVAKPRQGEAVELATPRQASQARAQLEGLQVKGRSAKTGYSSEAFMPNGWPSVGKGCDLRDQILTRQAPGLERDPKRPCDPVSGILVDPYSGAQLDLADAEVDHIVAKHDAYQKGARDDTATLTEQWPTAKDLRFAIATDPDNLVAVSGRLNSQKRSSDAASWVPPNKAYRCTYATRIVLVKHRYGLWVTPAEKGSLQHWLGTCPAPK